jgi:hypothetical protein
MVVFESHRTVLLRRSAAGAHRLLARLSRHVWVRAWHHPCEHVERRCRPPKEKAVTNYERWSRIWTDLTGSGKSTIHSVMHMLPEESTGERAVHYTLPLSVEGLGRGATGYFKGTSGDISPQEYRDVKDINHQKSGAYFLPFRGRA